MKLNVLNVIVLMHFNSNKVRLRRFKTNSLPTPARHFNSNKVRLRLYMCVLDIYIYIFQFQ